MVKRWIYVLDEDGKRTKYTFRFPYGKVKYKPGDQFGHNGKSYIVEEDDGFTVIVREEVKNK